MELQRTMDLVWRGPSLSKLNVRHLMIKTYETAVNTCTMYAEKQNERKFVRKIFAVCDSMVIDCSSVLQK